MPARKPIRSARVTTRTGDRGDTSLFSADRVRKSDPRIEALGDLDEAQAVIGVARSLAPRSALGRELFDLQHGLYLAMAEVATPRSNRSRLKERLDGASVATLEATLDTLKKRTPIAGRFVVPGENRFAATLDHARTVVRRAERKVVECVDEGYLDGEDLLPWLNRLSDALFVLARSAERSAPTRKIAKRDTRRRWRSTWGARSGAPRQRHTGSDRSTTGCAVGCPLIPRTHWSRTLAGPTRACDLDSPASSTPTFITITCCNAATAGWSSTQSPSSASLNSTSRRFSRIPSARRQAASGPSGASARSRTRVWTAIASVSGRSFAGSSMGFQRIQASRSRIDSASRASCSKRSAKPGRRFPAVG